MDIDKFNIKYKEWIDIGVISFNSCEVNGVKKDFITIDRFANYDDEDIANNILPSQELTAKMRSDVKRMGYQKAFGIGAYIK